MSSYSNSSPYYTTETKGFYLDIINFRSIPKNADDVEYEILSQYQYRPDLLAYDLYDDPKLWWVFSVRNPNIIVDPVFDMVPGIKIRLPKLETLKKYLGL